MDTQAFHKVYNESRNGCNGFVRHWANRSFEYSDGVEDLFNTGCAWLGDILATELPNVMRKARQPCCLVEVVVAKEQANLSLTHSDRAPPLWKRHIEYTDMPEGRWVFELVDEGARFALILLTER